MSHKLYIALGVLGASAAATFAAIALHNTDPYAGAGDKGAVLENNFNEMVPTDLGAFNNPGNLEKSPTTFQGEVASPSATMKSFVDMAHGYRAIIEVIRHYYKTGSLTLQDIIARYAPSSDGNNVDSYVQDVSNYTGINPQSDMYNTLWSNDVVQLVKAIARHEQGNSFVINNGNVLQGYLLA